MPVSVGSRRLSTDKPSAALEPRPIMRERYDATTLGVLGVVLALIAVGTALRVARLDHLVLSFDESYTFATAQRSFADMLSTFRFEANGIIYAIVLWPFLLLSEATAIVRAPAFVAGLATIPAVWWTGSALVGRRAALLAAGLVAVSPALIGWSVYGRGYALAVLFATLSFGCVARALGDDRRTRWIWLYVAAMLLTAYSSVTAALVLVPVHAVAVAWCLRTRGRLRDWLIPSAALAIALLPLAALLYVESTHRDPLHWLWKPDLGLVRQVSGELLAGPAYERSFGAGLAGAIVTVALGAVVAAVAVSGRRVTRPSWGVTLVLAWAAFPPVFLFVVSQVRPLFWGRYLGIVVPALALLVAALLARLPRALLAVYGIALAGLLLVGSFATPLPPRDYREIADWVEDRRDSSDPLVLYPAEQLPALAYHAHSLRVDGQVPVDEWDDSALPAGYVGYRRPVDWGDPPLGPPPAEDLARLSRETGSVYVLTYPNEDIPVTWADARGCRVERVRFLALDVVSIERCAAPGG
jgi:4-amino-4-deoxy-L-arabinose transferase-like glycosyltransferase